MTTACGKAAPWRFPSVEAIVSPDTRPITATWPHAWPTVAHERAYGDEGVRNVIDLPAEAYDQLHAMSRGRVQIGAQQYMVWDRVPWPQESLWSGRPPKAWARSHDTTCVRNPVARRGESSVRVIMGAMNRAGHVVLRLVICLSIPGDRMVCRLYAF